MQLKLQFKLKHILIAFVWLLFALPRIQDWSYEAHCAREGIAPYWSPMVPSFTAVPFLIATVLMVVGFPRAGLRLGVLTTVYVVLMFCVRWQHIRSMGIDPMPYWMWPQADD